MTGPTQRSLKVLRDQGYHAQVVEKWIPQCRKRIDLLGCIDIIGIEEGMMIPGTHRSLVGIQATSGANHAARIAKAKAEPRLRLWLETGARFEVWSWSKKGKADKRKLWTLRCERIVLEDLPERPHN